MSAAPAPKHRPARPAPQRPPLRAVPGPRRPKATPRPGGLATAPLGVRLALIPVRLALVPVRIAISVLARLTGGRPWLVMILALGCGVIALHAATLQTNQTVAARDLEINKLERETATLRNDVAGLRSTDRVAAFGSSQGMVIADPEGVGYLDARKADAGRSAGMLAPPSADWKPAPNPSEQNGDATDDAEGAAPGTGGVAGPAADPSTAGAAAAPTPSTPTPSAPAATGTQSASGTTGTQDSTGTTGTAGTTGGGAATGTTGTAGTTGGGTGTASAGTGTAAPAAGGTATGGTAAGGTTP
ncbi:MAG: hypothetical protein Q7T67_15010, partial [Patulibacter sp.]|nr:hypothetical protein [Patulibacter sp.]